MTSSKIINLSHFHLLARILLQEKCLPFNLVTLWSLMMVFMIPVSEGCWRFFFLIGLIHTFFYCFSYRAFRWTFIWINIYAAKSYFERFWTKPYKWMAKWGILARETSFWIFEVLRIFEILLGLEKKCQIYMYGSHC